MKKQYLLMAFLAVALMFTFSACGDDDKKDEPEGPAQIAVSDYPSYFPGAWEDSYATRYYCTDGTWYADYNNGNEAEGTWSLSGSDLTVNYSSGETYVYTIDYMYEDEYKIINNESGDEFTAALQTEDGCYWLDEDEYDTFIPGKWRYLTDDGEEDIYWLCDDNTFHFESTDHYDDYGTWSVSGDNLYINWSKGNTEKVTYTINKMRPDALYMTFGTGPERVWNRMSSDGCYEAPMGSLVFYLTSDCGCGPVTVSVNGNEVGEITHAFSEGDVDCGTDGAVTVDLAPGTYDIYAECQGLYWEFSTTVTDGDCTQEELGCSKAMAK